MKDIAENVVVFVLVLVGVFLFTGPDPVPFKVLQSHVRGTCK